MVVTFCGHSNFDSDDGIKKKFIEILEKEVGDNATHFYFGDYGGFDRFSKSVCYQYKKTHPNCKLYFVSPYNDRNYIKHRLYYIEGYDSSIIPDLKCFKKFGVLERNRWMVDQADLVIAFVEHSWGGASKTLNYAYKKNKRVINIASYFKD